MISCVIFIKKRSELFSPADNSVCRCLSSSASHFQVPWIGTSTKLFYVSWSKYHLSNIAFDASCILFSSSIAVTVHFTIGLPVGFLPSCITFIIRFGYLSSPILLTCPSHLNLLFPVLYFRFFIPNLSLISRLPYPFKFFLTYSFWTSFVLHALYSLSPFLLLKFLLFMWVLNKLFYFYWFKIWLKRILLTQE